MDTWNNNAFWNPNSMETLIFNSYVGGACIFELSGDKTELLRYNAEYAALFGRHFNNADIDAHRNMLSMLDDKNSAVLCKCLDTAVAAKKEASCELELTGRGNENVMYVRATVRLIAQTGQRQLFYCVVSDITEQRLAEKKALDASERVSAVMDNSHCGISAIVMREDGEVEYLFVNNRFYEILGYTRKQYEAEVKSPFDCVHPEDRDAIYNTVTKLTEIGNTASMQMRDLRRDGTVVWLRCDTAIVKFENIALPVQLSSFMDITEQKENEMKRLESARQLEVIMNNISGGVSAVQINDDGTSRFVFNNDKYYDLYGYTARQARDAHLDVMSLILPEDIDGVMALVKKLKADKRPTIIDYRVRKRDGSMALLRANASLMSIPGYGDDVITSVITDITEKRSVEDQLSAIVDNIYGGVTATVMKDGKLEFIIVNDRFIEILGYGSREEYERACGGDKYAQIHPDDKERIVRQFECSDGGKTRYTMEYRVIRKDRSIRYIRNNVSVIHLFGYNAPVQLSVANDVTDMVEAQMKQAATMERLKEANAQLRFLNDSAHDILAQPDSDMAIKKTLENMLDYFAGERSYIFEFDYETRTSDNTYEICAEGVRSEQARLQGVTFELQKFWMDAFKKDGFIAIPEIAKIDDSETEMRELLLSQNIHSLIVAALWRDNTLVGYMGIDNPAQAIDQVERLQALADYVAVLLTRRDLMRKIKHDTDAIKTLINDTPGGFIRMAIRPGKNPTIDTFNRGMCEMLGMTGDELMDAYGADAHLLFTPEDIAGTAKLVADAAANCGEYSCKCRLNGMNAEVQYVVAFGRFVRDENGDMFLNAYFTDITGSVAQDERQKALLDKLPFGMGVYEFDGENLRTYHLNLQYEKMVSRSDNSGKNNLLPTDYIHPDDRKKALDEIRDAIANHRKSYCDIRLLFGKDSYVPFHLDVNIVKKDKGKYMLYVAFSRISKE